MYLRYENQCNNLCVPVTRGMSIYVSTVVHKFRPMTFECDNNIILFNLRNGFVAKNETWFIVGFGDTPALIQPSAARGIFFGGGGNLWTF